MKQGYMRIMTTLAQGYAAGLAATAEVGGRALAAGAVETGRVSEAAARALRAPRTHRAAAVETVVLGFYDAQTRQLQTLESLSALWSMAFLRHMDAGTHSEQSTLNQ